MTLLVHWPLDETSGTQATDASGNGRHGTLYGGKTFAETGSGGVGLGTGGGPGNTLADGGVALVDAVDHIAGPTGDAITFPFTIMGWIKQLAGSNADPMVVVTSASGRSGIIKENNGSVTEGLRLEGVTPAAESTTSRDNTVWRHVAVTYPVDGVASLYRDGAVVAQNAGTSPDTTGATMTDFLTLAIAAANISAADRSTAGITGGVHARDVRLRDDTDVASIKAAFALGFTGTVANITSHTAAQNIEHPSGDAGTVLTIAADGTANADGVGVSYALSGTDAAQFTVNPSTGVVAFAATPDYASPTDANTDNVYELNLIAVHPAGDDTVAVTVTVTSVGPPVNTVAPVISKVV